MTLNRAQYTWLCDMELSDGPAMLQIVMNYQRKSTGELAPTTLVLQAAGNLARIFTTIVQVGRS